MGMVGQPQNHIREHRRIRFQHVYMQVIVILWVGSVIRVALHQHQLFVDSQNGMDGALDFANGRGTRGDKERLAFARHPLQRFDPVNFSRTGLIDFHIRIEEINGFKIIG